MTLSASDPSSSQTLLDHVRAVRAQAPVNRAPLYKTVGYTLDISARFLAAATLGRGSVAVADRLIDGYWRRIFQSGNASLVVEGRAHFDGRAAIVMSNHTSLLDIPAIMGAVPGSMRMVMKHELSRIPVWGPALVKSGFVPVERGTRSKAIEQLSKAEEVLGQGVHIWIAPEGTRSRDGALLPFKKGGFHLARKLRAPIIPTWIEGASRIIPPDSFRVVHDGSVVVRFGAPIETDRSDMPLEALMEQVRAAMTDLSGAPADSAKAAA